MKISELSREEIEEIVHLYSVKKLSIEKIRRIKSIGSRSISKILKNEQVHIRDNREYNQLPIDDSYFEKIDSPNKAYILGFLFADGCITFGKVLTVSATEKNLESLKILKKELKSEKDIQKLLNKQGYGKGKYHYRFSVTNKKIYDDLYNLGMVPKKSLSCQYPSREVLPQKYDRDFIRGYFDGNGSVYKPNNISFTSGSHDILESIRQILNKEFDSQAKLHPYSNKNAYDLKYGGKNQIVKIYHYFYDDAELFLKRKKDIFEEII